MSMTGTTSLPEPRQAELKPLFEPLKAGDIEVPNRIFMAPLTRNRAHEDGTPSELAIDYYRQRASAGLIITEASQISAMGKGYLDTPGIHENSHVEGWKKITEAVHEAGGRIAIQLWHVGRISHTSLLPGGASPLAPSVVRAKTQTFTKNGFEDVSEPQAMSLDQIRQTIDDYARAARLAVKAGFDGVEIHAANGYLIDQFLSDATNQRDDEYGGAIEHRIRFLREVTDAVTSEIAPGRTGVRLSPYGQANDMSASDQQGTYGVAVDVLNGRGLSYLHFVERFSRDIPEDVMAGLATLAERWDGVFVPNGSFNAAEAAEWIAAGKADAVAFGKLFISNPDLPARFALGAELNEWDQSTFYGGGAEGYTDYPALGDQLTA
ncbi:alkene reductase [Parvularcula marina]|uniref:Alkene reductase n=1 Tax=Parvularcula marina TaxID=2292771 RepID=A0A371RJC6_9PROT|nr:alkene reductase [Parvularcula marina]RFB05555.1 alkene reductase [Parvularcula marina]